MSDLDAFRAALTEASAATGGFDVVINNAAIYPSKPFDEFTVEEHQAVQRVHVHARIVAVQVALPTMRPRGWGRIVNVARVTVYRVSALLWPSFASHGALVGLARAWACEFVVDGSTVDTNKPRNRV